MEAVTPHARPLDRLRIWWRRLPRRTALLTIGVAPLVALLLFSFAWERCFFARCPDVEGLAAYQPGGAPILLDRNGEVFADLTPVSREVVPLFELPAHVAQAFLAVEDRRFYEHTGVDWRRVGGSMLANLRAGGFEEGFSTITMQLARNIFPETIPGEERTPSRKLLEVRVAQEIEARYSKDEILELYLNHIYFGNRARGIEAAARQYFGCSAKELTLPQAAVLAALPKAPSHYDPRRHPEAALERRNLVLGIMEEQGKIPRLMAKAARNEPMEIAPPPPPARVEAGLAPWYVEQVRSELETRFGSDLYARPLRIRTTLDSRAQRAAEEELSRQLRMIEIGEAGAFNGPRYSASATPSAKKGPAYLQGAVLLMDAKNGDVLAWVGGRNFAHSQFDRVSQARRQAGSAFKPFVYAAALAQGWVLSQPLTDRPLRLAMGREVWAPENFTGEYEGEVTVRDALVRSKNVATIRLASSVGLDQVAGMAKTAGIEERIPEVPSVALGSVAVSPLEMTTAFSGFAGLGQAVEPRLVLAIENEDGKVLWRSEPRRRKVIDPGIAYLVTDVLAESLDRGTGIPARLGGGAGGKLKVPAAGKTGTTNDGADAWFIGYTPDLVGGVWLGFDRPRPIVEDATGGRLAAPIWGRVVQRVYQTRKPPQPWAAPAGILGRAVDPGTGLLLKKGCAPLAGKPYRELFLEDSLPSAYCPGKEPVPANGFPSVQRLAEREEREREQKAEIAARRDADQKQMEENLRREREAARQQERIAEDRRREAAEQQAAAKEEREDELARVREAQRAAEQAQAQKEEQAKLAQQSREKAQDQKAAARTIEKEKLAKAEQERLARIEAREKELEKREAEIARAERKQRQREAAAQSDRDMEAKRKVEVKEEEEEEVKEEKAEEEEADDADAPDLSGWWEMTNRIQSTNYAQYKGLRLGYRIHLEQEGNRITGRGQKWTEDGRSVAAAARTPLTITGTVEGRTVKLKFTEQGTRRSTNGGFTWTLSADRSRLNGSFWSDAADTSGSSSAVRMD